MNDATAKNFGLLIAYVLPGFVVLWALRTWSPVVQAWLDPSPTIPAGVESLVFVLLASITAGMSVSALRWLVVDTLHHITGLTRPDWDDSLLPTHLTAFDAIVEWHYRHYQFYANTAIALLILLAAEFAKTPVPHPGKVAVFLVLEALFIATSRDTLRKYYARATRLLGTLPRADRSPGMANGSHPPKSPAPQKPATETKKPSSSSK